MRTMKALLASLLVYVVAVGWLTWPLATRMATHLPATRAPWAYDAIYGIWALAHETHAFARLPDAAALATLRRETGLALILVHASDLVGPARQGWLALAGGPRPDILCGRATATTCCSW